MTGIYILGTYYPFEDITKIIKGFIYITYRSNFTKIADTDLVSDIGWGCTIRSGQMLLANTFIRHHLKMLDYKSRMKHLPKCYYNILSYFRDSPKNIFSIHRFVEKYSKYDKTPGDWIGPFTIAKMFEDFSSTIYELASIKYIIANNSNLDTSLIHLEEPTAYMVTIPIRLAVDKIDEEYYENIIYITKCPQFMGILGGENNKSYYFIGSQDNLLVYLDPHKTHKYQDSELDLSSYESDTIQHLSLENLSPTLTICFYIESNQDLLVLENIPDQLPNKDYQLFSINKLDDTIDNIVIVDDIDNGWGII